MQLTEQQFKMGEILVTKEYDAGVLTNMYVQKDGKTLFDGDTQDATDVLDALKAVLYEEVL